METTEEIHVDDHTETQPRRPSTTDRLFDTIEKQRVSAEELHKMQSAERKEATHAMVTSIKDVQKELRRSTLISLAAVCLLAVTLTGGNFALKAFGIVVSSNASAVEDTDQ